MQAKFFRRVDTLMGCSVFLLSAVVYGLTLEPTASLWDCSEFIISGNKLEVGHPPGAPFFMLAANLFSHFAADASQVAFWVNMLSALLSAGCILFLFWTITHMARRLLMADGPYTRTRVCLVEACGAVGALVYAFSDTFWFSAVEAEVYAFSSFLTALVFWLMLRWEDEADSPDSDRWLVLIAYLIGLSIGVHLLNLLCIPAMVLVFHFRRFPHAAGWRILPALLIGALLVGAVLYGLIPGVLWLAGLFELLLVNTCGLPYQSGLFSFMILLTLVLSWAVWRARLRVVRTSLLCIAMMLVGYSCYGVILIRAQACTPMNENAPDNVFALRSYLAREQYGEVPLIYGPAYTSQVDYEQRGDHLVAKVKDGAPVYRRAADSTICRYEVARHRPEITYAENMWFPRMYSQRHREAYESWMGGVRKKNNLPTVRENLRFFFTYQVNHMYFRYFFWNFVGRQNDIQGHGEVEHGNWITGIPVLDNLLLGCDTARMPAELRDNPGRNVYYALPLLLGLAGLYWQSGRGRAGLGQFWVVTLFFLMTGLAIVLYLNQYPNQPRERDYAYAGSFYAFSIWIGLGVAAVFSFFRRLRASCRTSVFLSVPLCGLVPLQVIGQTWDDHDRSGRYACRDFGRNYLESLSDEGSPVILTSGDNDTFPLWYCQEVEGVRTDARVCNLQYLMADWYIDQMKRPAYESPALPFTWAPAQYREGTRDYIPVRPGLKPEVEHLYEEHPEEMKRMLGESPFELRKVMQNWVLSDNAEMRCVPADTVTVTPEDGTPQMTLSFTGQESLYKSDLFVLEMLSHADRSRPLYVSVSTNLDEIPYLRDHLVQEGLAYRVVARTCAADSIDVDRSYELFMHRFSYGGMSGKNVYADESVRRLVYTHQRAMSRLMEALLARGDGQRALEVAKKWEQEFPLHNVPPMEYALTLARCYYANADHAHADEWLGRMLSGADEWLAWLRTVRPGRLAASLPTVHRQLRLMQGALLLAKSYQRESILQSYTQKFMTHVQNFETR